MQSILILASFVLSWLSCVLFEFCYSFEPLFDVKGNSMNILLVLKLPKIAWPRDKFMLLWQKWVKDVSVGFRPPCWCPSGWVSTWRLHTNLYKFRLKTALHILLKKNWPESWREFLHIYHLSFPRLLTFYFDLFWMAWHWRPEVRSTMGSWQYLVRCWNYYAALYGNQINDHL